jgi:hypothetical protein
MSLSASATNINLCNQYGLFRRYNLELMSQREDLELQRRSRAHRHSHRLKN